MDSNYYFEKFDWGNPFILKLKGEELKALLSLLDSKYGESALPVELEPVRVDLHTHLILFYEKKSTTLDAL